MCIAVCNLKAQRMWRNYIIIPQSYNKSLEKWINDTQRKNEKKLSPENICRLDEVCENWRVSNSDAVWELSLFEVKEWKEEQIVSMTFK